MRRALFQLLAGLPLVSGDGLRRPVNAPAGYRPGPGVQPGVSPPLVIANYVVVFGPAGTPSGVFVYQPGTIPKLGNPPVAWMSEATADPYGNVLPTTGIVSSSGTGWMSMESGQLSFSNGAFISEQAAPNYLVFGGVPLNVLEPFISPLVAVEPGTTATAEGWHPMTLVNGWANTAGFAAAQYRFLAAPANDVEITGVINSTAATSTTFATLPAGYRPANANGYAVGATANVPAGSSPQVRCSAAGVLTVNGGPAFPSAVSWFINGLISLDA